MKPSYTWDVRQRVCKKCGQERPLNHFELFKRIVKGEVKLYRLRSCQKCWNKKRESYKKKSHTSHP